MPEIVGLVTKMPRQEAELQLSQMVEKLCHEDFNMTATWVDETRGVYIGWVARKGSFSDGMPLRNEKRDAVRIFSGEEFPDGDTRGRLRHRGHVFDRTGPSYLVHLYEDDTTFPACLNGRFHGLLIDQTRKTLILFNNRYGMDQIYYNEAKHAFYFAAEAKEILAVCSELRKMEHRSLGKFVACGCILEDRTLFERVHVLPCAAEWILLNG